MSIQYDLIGRKFGRLNVVSLNPIRSRSKGKRWECVCDCGNKCTIVTTSIVTGRSMSCGCLHSEMLVQRNTTHAGYGTTTYNSWSHMMRRCYDTEAINYSRYGGRGVAVCERWKSFENFRDDMGERPQGLTIERIDNLGDYEAANCKWATYTEQNSNRRDNIILSHGGKLQTLSAWARELGVKIGTLWYRVKSGWNTERVLTTPVRNYS